MRFVVSDAPHPARQAGISIRVGNKIIGIASHFGLEDDPELPRGLLNHVFGEIEVDGLGPGVTADGGGFTEGYIGHEAIRPLVRDAVKKALQDRFPREIGLHKGRLTQEQERRLAQMPEHRRHFAQLAVKRTMEKFYGESADRIETVANVVLDAIERDDYYEVLRAIDESLASEVAKLAEALQDFGIVDMAQLGAQARSRLRLLDHFESLVDNSSTVEKQVHEVVEKNRWVLGFDYPIVSSNQTLANVISKYVKDEFKGPRANKRPDLFLGKHLKGNHLLIEFKRPQHSISRDDQNQAVKYRDDLTKQFGDIDILLLGKGREPNLSTQFDSRGLTVMSYKELISSAREQLNWLLDSIRDAEVSA